MSKSERIKAARAKFENKLIGRLGYETFKEIQPYINTLITDLTGRKPVTPPPPPPTEPVEQQPSEHITLMQWQLDGKTVADAVAELIN